MQPVLWLSKSQRNPISAEHELLGHSRAERRVLLLLLLLGSQGHGQDAQRKRALTRHEQTFDRVLKQCWESD